MPPALERVRLGDLDDLEVTIDGASIEPSLRLALQARASLFDPVRFLRPSPDMLMNVWTGEGVSDSLCEAAALDLTRHALLDFDASALEEILRLFSAEKKEAGLAGKIIESWRSAIDSSVPFDDDQARQLESSAGIAQEAELVLDACAARSLGVDRRGPGENFLESARRGSRMARTEARPLHEFFAHLILARARRMSRHPHLAIRVLTSLAEYSPSPFHPWIAWELFFAGATRDEILHRLPQVERGSSRSSRALGALFEMTDAAGAGVLVGFEEAANRLKEQVSCFAPARCDALTLIEALRPNPGSEGEHRQFADWQTGRVDVAPAAIHGLCLRAERDATDELSECYVATGFEQVPRRVLGMGAPLFEVEGATRLRRTRRRQGRVETMAAVLALAGPSGLVLPEAFRPAYGFEYVPEIHQGVVDVLMQRLRTYLGEAAELVRQGGHVALIPKGPLLVPDPRSAPVAYDRVLRILAREGKAKAKDAAQASGLSVRAAQIALKGLIEAGLCTVEKEGKQVLYAVEDTTFSEPTLLIRRSRASLNSSSS